MSEAPPTDDGPSQSTGESRGAARSPRGSVPDLLALHGVRLLGFATSAAVASRFALHTDEVEELLLDAEASGLVTRHRGTGPSGWSLTELGKARDEQLLAAEIGDSAEVVRQVHDAFVPLNGRFQAAVTRWQIRPLPGDQLAVNDHSDHRWDDRVIGELGYLAAAGAILGRRLAAELDRFAGYDARLADARDRMQRGERAAVDGLRGETAGRDSLHTVWFELHEDLISTLGLER